MTRNDRKKPKTDSEIGFPPVVPGHPVTTAPHILIGVVMTAARLTRLPAWAALQAHHARVKNTHLRELFAADPTRGESLTAEAAGVFLDYSKNRVTDETLKLLVKLADECGLRARIDAMFAGERINVSEN